MAAKINIIKDTFRTTQINFNHFNTVAAKISQLVAPIFNKIKVLSSKHLGNPTYLLVNQEDMVAKKILKISSWLFGISPIILLGACIYDHLLDLYHYHFENYSRIEEYPNEISENLESPVYLPQDRWDKIEHLPEPTIPQEELRIPINADVDISGTTAETEVDSGLEEGQSDYEEKITADVSNTFSQTMLKNEVKDCPEERDLPHFRNQRVVEPKKPSNNDSIRMPTTVEILKPQQPEAKPTGDILTSSHSEGDDDDSSNATTDSLEASFEQVNMTPELVEEMKNSPEMPSPPSGMVNRIREMGKGIIAFWANNPLTSNKPNIITSPKTILEDEHQAFSYKEFNTSDPIIIGHNTTKSSAIYPIADSLVQIKKDLDRHMLIFVNGQQCHSVEELIKHFPIQLNESKTDLLPNYDPIIPIILNFANQTILNFGASLFAKDLWERSNYSLHATSTTEENQSHMDPIIHINWDPNFPEKMKMIADTSRMVISLSDYTVPLAFYKVKVTVNKDQTEVTWNMIEEPSSQTPADSPATEEAEQSKRIQDPIVSTERDEDFQILEEDSKDIVPPMSDYNRALSHLINEPNACLNSTVISEYLKSLKTKHSTFVYEDRLMFPGSITTDEIVNSLNKLKNNDPTNQTIFLPFIVKGRTVDHAVVAVINLANETIEYFDPKGQSSVWPTRAEKQSNKNVFDFLTELGQKFISPIFSKEKIVYNKKNVPQGFFDSINCGAFCLQFIEERITRPFNDIENDLAVDPKKLRLELANRLIKNTHSNSI